MITDQEIKNIATTLANAKKQYDHASANAKEQNDVMVKAKEALLTAVLAANNIPEGHYEQLAKKNLVYDVGHDRPIILEGRDSVFEEKTYTPEQLDYMKKIKDQIEQLQLKLEQVVPVKVEKHVTRSYNVKWGKGT